MLLAMLAAMTLSAAADQVHVYELTRVFYHGERQSGDHYGYVVAVDDEIILFDCTVYLNKRRIRVHHYGPGAKYSERQPGQIVVETSEHVFWFKRLPDLPRRSKSSDEGRVLLDCPDPGRPRLCV